MIKICIGFFVLTIIILSVNCKGLINTNQAENAPNIDSLLFEENRLHKRSFSPYVTDTLTINFNLPWTQKSLTNPILVFDLTTPSIDSLHYQQLDTVIMFLKNNPGFKLDLCHYAYSEFGSGSFWSSRLRRNGEEYEYNFNQLYNNILLHFKNNNIQILANPNTIDRLCLCRTDFPIEDSLIGNGEKLDVLRNKLLKIYPEKLIIRFEATGNSKDPDYDYTKNPERCVITYPVY